MICLPRRAIHIATHLSVFPSMLRTISAQTPQFIMEQPICHSLTEFLNRRRRQFGFRDSLIAGSEVQEREQRACGTLCRKTLGAPTEQSELKWFEIARQLHGTDDSLDRRSMGYDSFRPLKPPVRPEDPRSSPCIGDLQCRRVIPERPISGSKRRINETENLQKRIDGHCSSHPSQKPTKKLRKSGHKKRPRGDSACGSSTNCKNSTGDECKNPPTSASNLFSEIENEVNSIPKQATPSAFDLLPAELLANILLRVGCSDLFRFKTLSKSCKQVVEDDSFRQVRGEFSEGSFTAINYYIKDGAWRCSAYDLLSQSWIALRPFSFLPAPDASLFKEYSVTGHGGLMCADVSKLPERGELVVFNPLTGEKRVLPPLLYPRNVVLLHLVVDPVTRSFKVVVAGSSAASDEHLSKKVEVFDSSTSEWKEACDLPGPAFGLNEHQAGVYLDGKLFLISFLEGDCRRGVVAFDVEKGEWLKNLTCPIPFSSSADTLQLVESDGRLYVFSEQERGCSVEHCIDEVEFPDADAGATSCRLRNVVRVKKSGGRGLQVYPEHSCVGFGEGKLCIFNTLNRKGAVYDMRDGKQCEELQPPPADQRGENFFSMNPASFSLQGTFARLSQAR